MKQLTLILATLISITLFIGGIILILSQIPFWSLFLGIGAIQIGIVFLIFTYEKLSSNYIINTFVDINPQPSPVNTSNIQKSTLLKYKK